jgi:2-polyprenyl-3-methyl-5-hydroxy-6-metoxy-1,4-benzoquinol methylase
VPKKILFESAVHQFLRAAEYFAERERRLSSGQYRRWSEFILSLHFAYPRPNLVSVEWSSPRKGNSTFSIDQAQFYTRGDNNESVKSQRKSGFLFHDDSIQQANLDYFRSAVLHVAAEAGLSPTAAELDETADRLHAEEHFHDGWASAEDVFKINVRQMNEACTAPEMRFIRRALGDVKGKTLLDVGSGLGEASVYFALEGADVTATDISQKMLDVAKQLAEKNGTTIKVHKSAAENLALPAGLQFDIVYAGNLFHHVDLEPTLRNILRHLKPNGVLVSWDPVAYNPVINVYRKKAMQVRTVDEHPFTLADIKTFKRHFDEVRTRWFWLTTLSIFLLMAFVQRRDPNKERYWKKVIEEADTWSWLYIPLEALDRALLTIFPFLGPLCWNVVVVARKPKSIPTP